MVACPKPQGRAEGPARGSVCSPGLRSRFAAPAYGPGLRSRPAVPAYGPGLRSRSGAKFRRRSSAGWGQSWPVNTLGSLTTQPGRTVYAPIMLITRF